MYAGFWKRAAALTIDIIILIIPSILFSWILTFIIKDNNLLIRVIASLVFMFYWVIMESSPMQATLGKAILGIKVTDMQGNRITFLRSLGRRLSTYISAITIYFGYTMAGFTVRRQCLHDKIAGTLVVNKDADMQNGAQPVPFNILGCIAGVISSLIVLAGIVMLGMLVAIYAAAAAQNTKTAPAAQEESYYQSEEDSAQPSYGGTQSYDSYPQNSPAPDNVADEPAAVEQDSATAN